MKVLDYQPVELETKSLSDENKLDLKQPTQLEQLKLDEIRKPLWLKASRKNLISLIKHVVDNLNSDKYKTSVNDLKNAEKFLLEIITKTFRENEARRLFNDLIKPDVDTLMKSTSRCKDKRSNILSTLSNVEWVVFGGLYFDYDDKPESKSEESIAERTKLRRQRFDEIAEKGKMISSKLFEKYFGYWNPSDMYEALNETTGLKENKAQVNMIENRLANLMEVLKSSPTSDAVITCWKLLNLVFTLIN